MIHIRNIIENPTGVYGSWPAIAIPRLFVVWQPSDTMYMVKARFLPPRNTLFNHLKIELLERLDRSAYKHHL